MTRGLILIAMTLLWLGAAAAEGIGVVTILEGQAVIHRGTTRLQAAEGMAVSNGDIVHTAADTFMQVELSDQTVLQLGPQSRGLLGTPSPKGKPERALYLMDGWIKMAPAKREGATGLDLRTPSIDMPANASVVVLQQTPAEAVLFAERGNARVVERVTERGATGPTVTVPSGELYRRKAGARGAIDRAELAQLLQRMPRAFRDSLPLRAERFKDNVVRPRDLGEVSYDDVKVWLQAEPSLRRPLMPRWRPKVRESAFRQALIANLSSHPEWDPILFPEKYLPKDPPPRPVIGAASAVKP